MKTFTDEEMGQLLPTRQAYSVVILKQGPRFSDDGDRRSSGSTAAATSGCATTACSRWCLPVTDGSDVCGIGVFAATVDDTVAIMDDDPGVAAGVFSYEVHPCRGFPGDSLP